MVTAEKPPVSKGNAAASPAPESALSSEDAAALEALANMDEEDFLVRIGQLRKNLENGHVYALVEFLIEAGIPEEKIPPLFDVFLESFREGKLTDEALATAAKEAKAQAIERLGSDKPAEEESSLPPVMPLDTMRKGGNPIERADRIRRMKKFTQAGWEADSHGHKAFKQFLVSQGLPAKESEKVARAFRGIEHLTERDWQNLFLEVEGHVITAKIIAKIKSRARVSELPVSPAAKTAEVKPEERQSRLRATLKLLGKFIVYAVGMGELPDDFGEKRGQVPLYLEIPEHRRLRGVFMGDVLGIFGGIGVSEVALVDSLMAPDNPNQTLIETAKTLHLAADQAQAMQAETVTASPFEILSAANPRLADSSPEEVTVINNYVQTLRENTEERDEAVKILRKKGISEQDIERSLRALEVPLSDKPITIHAPIVAAGVALGVALVLVVRAIERREKEQGM